MNWIKGKKYIVREGDLDWLSEENYINVKDVEEIGFFQINKKEDTILHRVIFLKDYTENNQILDELKRDEKEVK